MLYRLFIVLIFILPIVYKPPLKNVLFVSADCPACFYKIVKLEARGPLPRFWAVDQSIEVNCLMGKLYGIDPRHQVKFLEYLHTHPEKIELSRFCLEIQVDKHQLLECKHCSFLQLSVLEILYYVMSKFLSTIPYGMENR